VSPPPLPPPPPPPLCPAPLGPRDVVANFGTALEDYDGKRENGVDYLSFKLRDRIMYQSKPLDVEHFGWEYGHVVATASTGWFPPTYVKPDEANEVQPEDSVSHIAGEDHMIDASDNETSSHSSLSMVSSAGCGQTCFSQGTLIRKSDAEWIKIEHLKPFDYVLGTSDQLQRVMSVERIEGSQPMMEVFVGGTKSVTTSSHRFMVIRGGRPESAPASSLRVGDDVQHQRAGDHGNIVPQPVTRIVSYRDDCLVYRVAFYPDEPVPTIYADAILTKGHRVKSQDRRGGGRRGGGTLAIEPSIPETAAEAEWR
jgi:hypothetical protein